MYHELLSRRSAMFGIGLAAGSIACSWNCTSAEERARRITGMGLVIYDCNIRRKWMRQKQPDFDLFEPLTFLRHCQSLGCGGMQANLGVLSAQKVNAIREFSGKHDLFIDAIIKPPVDKSDVSRFEAEIVCARDVGVQAARATIIPGRRYERFQTLAEFREYETRGRKMLERAVPIVEKHRVPLAVENHKDQRIDERVALFEHLGSAYVGACVDTGNSFALLDGAYRAIEALAPYAFTVHLKDQGLKAYDDGFLLGDIPLGQGSFALKRMVEILRKQKPGIRFALELITRDALQVPCLTDGYWATLPEVPAVDLARTLRFVKQNEVKKLQSVSKLSLQKQVELEDANVTASLDYAGEQLKL